MSQRIDAPFLEFEIKQDPRPRAFLPVDKGVMPKIVKPKTVTRDHPLLAFGYADQHNSWPGMCFSRYDTLKLPFFESRCMGAA